MPFTATLTTISTIQQTTRIGKVEFVIVTIKGPIRRPLGIVV